MATHLNHTDIVNSQFFTADKKSWSRNDSHSTLPVKGKKQIALVGLMDNLTAQKLD